VLTIPAETIPMMQALLPNILATWTKPDISTSSSQLGGWSSPVTKEHSALKR